MTTISTPASRVVNSSSARFIYFDVEALHNAFTVALYLPFVNVLEVYVLLDTSDEHGNITPLGEDLLRHGGLTEAVSQAAARQIDATNPAWAQRGDRHFVLRDLRQQANAQRLAQIIGLYDGGDITLDHAAKESSFSPNYRLVCDSDPEYDPFLRHPYLCGFNSGNYDTTILAIALRDLLVPETFEGKPFSVHPQQAAILRDHSNQMFTEEFISRMPRYLNEGSVSDGDGWGAQVHKIRRAMLRSGRHLDISNLNEPQKGKISLKGQLAGLGRQIRESERLGQHNNRLESVADLLELLAYNVSDVVGLEQVKQHPIYSSSFDLKRGLMDTYPETVFSSPTSRQVRKQRMTPDSTSANFVATILSPTGSLSDIPVVSFNYPSDRVVAETGARQMNVLEEARAFFHENVTNEAARAQFQEVYDYYASIQGKNFNESENYTREHGEHHRSYRIKEIAKTHLNMPYYDANGEATSCYVTFSTGGIHGAEQNLEHYNAEIAEFLEEVRQIEAAKVEYPDPKVFAKTKPTHLADGTAINYKRILGPKQAATIKGAAYRIPELPKTHHLFRSIITGEKAGENEANTRYAFTSAEAAIHEDFVSYYPNLLTNMSAFYNEALGEDRYSRIFEDKERYGRMMKDASISPEEKIKLGILRNGTKLILNSASGAGDTFYDNPIRMNNTILSMRIIGQLFSWWIGQAQAIAGARIISTNTDGLYSVLDEETNNRVLAEQSARINIEIEPEPLLVISKDSNGRLELEMPDPENPNEPPKIIGASGGTLSCWNGPSPLKKLSHPAVIDRALVFYLRAIVAKQTLPGRDVAPLINQPLDREVGRQLLQSILKDEDPVFAAKLFQNIVTASGVNHPVPFGFMEDQRYSDPAFKGPLSTELRDPQPLQKVSRIFFVRQGTPGARHLKVAGDYKISAPAAAARLKSGAQGIVRDPVAKELLHRRGYTTVDTETAKGYTLLPEGNDVVVRNLTGINPSWLAIEQNEDLHLLPEVVRNNLLKNLDLEVYLELLATTFENNWMNQPILTELPESD